MHFSSFLCNPKMSLIPRTSIINYVCSGGLDSSTRPFSDVLLCLQVWVHYCAIVLSLQHRATDLKIRRIQRCHAEFLTLSLLQCIHCRLPLGATKRKKCPVAIVSKDFKDWVRCVLPDHKRCIPYNMLMDSRVYAPKMFAYYENQLAFFLHWCNVNGPVFIFWRL